MDAGLDAGELSAWAAGALAAIRGEGDAVVPCGSCTACCESSQFVHIAPDELDALAHIPRDLLFPAPRAPRGHVLMGYDEHGRCPMLVHCAICTAYLFLGWGKVSEADTRGNLDSGWLSDALK